jgi:hypothetical protein
MARRKASQKDTETGTERATHSVRKKAIEMVIAKAS